MNIDTSTNDNTDDKSNSGNDEENNKKEKVKVKFYETWTFIIFVCVIVPFAFRSLFYAPFHIPSSSMKSTLLIGDYLFVDKSAYGYSRYSFPFGIDFFDGRISEKIPERGDVIVFRPTTATYMDFIKRLVGLPGDRIQVKNGELYINDTKVERVKIDDFVEVGEDGQKERPITRYKETLPNGVSYNVLDDNVNGDYDNTKVFVVPDNNYFFMGDNRDNSADSRTKTVGFVPAENLVGRAEKIIVSTNGSIWKFWTWGSSIRTERAFNSIK